MSTVNAVGNGLTGASGTGNFAGTTSPTFVTPVLGTPTSGTLSSCTGYAQSALTGLGTGVSAALGVAVTGSGAIVLANGPTFVTSTVTAPSVTFSTTSGIIGTTTNNNAAAGSVGEVISSSIALASGITLTSATSADVTSISLTAGDWDVYGNVLTSSDANSLTQAYCWISTTSATLPDLSLVTGFNANAVLAFKYGSNAPTVRISIGSTTTVYLSCQAGFAAGNVKGCGTIWARRAR